MRPGKHLSEKSSFPVIGLAPAVSNSRLLSAAEPYLLREIRAVGVPGVIDVHGGAGLLCPAVHFLLPES